MFFYMAVYNKMYIIWPLIVYVSLITQIIDLYATLILLFSLTPESNTTGKTHTNDMNINSFDKSVKGNTIIKYFKSFIQTVSDNV